MKNKCKILIVISFIIIFAFNSLTVYANNDLEVNAKSALIIELNSGKVIYEKDKDERNFPASVTKILTAILVIENCNLDDKATVSESTISRIPTGYVVAPLYVGEKIEIKDLLYALMLKSANDAAYVLAEHVGGSVSGFSDMMNEKAKELGCKHSHFVNPNGIHDENHYSTAYDLYLIANYAMKNETFSKIVSTYSYTLQATNKYQNKDRVMKNTNSFINPSSSYYNETVNGIKTGTTTQAGNCLITDFSKDGLEFISVILGAETSDSKFSETKKIIKYSYNNYTLTKLHEKGETITSIEVEKATEETKNLDLTVSDDITVMHNVDIKKDEMIPEIELKDSIVAPISYGQEIGTIKYNIDGLEYEAKLLAANDVDRRTYYKEIMIVGGIGCFLVIVVVIVKKLKK